MAATLATAAGCAAVFAAYWLLRQDAFHGLDAYRLLPRIEAGHSEHRRHVLYMHLACGSYGLLQAWGATAFDVMRLIAAAAAAVGVVATFWSWTLLGLDRRRALLTAATAALLPGVVHFATMAEINSVAFGASAVAFCAFAGAMRDGSRSTGGLAWRMAPVGLLTAVGAGLHSIGNLTPLMLGLFVLLWPGAPRGRLWAVAALATAHAAGYAVVLQAAGSVGAAAEDHAGFYASLAPRTDNLPHVLWYEWLYPFAPVSVLWSLAAATDALGRRLATGCGIALLGYLAVDQVILGSLVDTGTFLPSGVLAEYGAYALPIVAPITGLALRSLPWRWGAVVTLTASLVGTSHWLDHRAAAANPALRAEIEEALTDGHTRLLVADHDEVGIIVRAAADADYSSVPAIAFEAYARQTTDPEQLSIWFDLQFRALRAAGKQLLLSRRAIQAMKENDVAPVRALADHIPAHYDLVQRRGGELLVVTAR